MWYCRSMFFNTTNYKQQKQKKKATYQICNSFFKMFKWSPCMSIVHRPRTDSHWVTHCYSLISKWSHQLIYTGMSSIIVHIVSQFIAVHVSCMYILSLFMIPWSYMSQRHPCIKDKNITWFIDRIFTHMPIHQFMIQYWISLLCLTTYNQTKNLIRIVTA